jgi:hypothetical protein
MVNHQSASTAVHPHIDDSPSTIYVNILYTIIPVFLKLETCRRCCVKLHPSSCTFGWLYIVITQVTIQLYALTQKEVTFP